jgi:predicted ATP-grasp superfamily ATP-dependent carboligase
MWLPYRAREDHAIVSPTLIIAGASARAAAASALRAGFTPWCTDLFADVDLLRACPVRRIALHDYPRGILAALRDAPPGPWMYTGALENRPDLVARVDRPLWGNPADVLRRVRSPFRVAEALGRRGLPCPAVCSGPPTAPARCWLIKPRRGAGGAGIRFHDPARALPARAYLHEWIDGVSCSAVFIGDGSGQVELFGTTRQLIGETWLHAPPFHWCGNIGPLRLPAETQTTLERIGRALVEDFGLRGLFGVDFVLRDGVPWPVEVNPRYPASVEVLERATEKSALLASYRACPGGARPVADETINPAPADLSRSAGPSPPVRPGRDVLWGKAVVFAPRSLVFPAGGPWESALAMPLHDPEVLFADIPAPGTRVEAGQPVCTVFASGTTIAECAEGLRRRAQATVP